MASQKHNLLTVGAFIGSLWLCFAGTWLGWGQFNPANERRALAPLPRLDRTFPEGLGLYVRDHFGFRGGFVALNAWLRVQLFHTSTSGNVIIGEEGFLFFAGEGALENYAGSKPMSDCELDAWVRLFERRAEFMSSKGIPFVVVLAPNKEAVYPEMMPPGILRGPGKSRLDRFVELLRIRTRIPLIDLRAALINKKAEHKTYYLTDTHWSPWGAYWAYRAMLPLLDRGAKPIEVAELSRGVRSQTFDLSRMLGLDGFGSEKAETFDPPRAPRITGEQDGPMMLSEAPAGPRLVFFRDSFGAALMPFLSQHFSLIYAPNGWTFDPAVVAREVPDVVALEMVERRLNQPPPVDPGGTGQICPAN